ncbi:MAG: phosphatase PAP2 family protein [Pseudomonadota bacterium]
MENRSIFYRAYAEVRRPLRLIAVLLIGLILSTAYPSDLTSYPVAPGDATTRTAVRLTEHYLRYVPTILQLALPALLRDKIGMVQLLYVAVSTTSATHVAKYLLDDVAVMGTRLGQRPRGGSRNMPSGHSSMVSSAAYFVGRRYSIGLGLFLLTIVGLTMYARVSLNAHTVSAVIAGALLGCLTAAWFTSRRNAQ